jgi:hypothetical protein
MDVQRYLAGEPVLAVPPSAGYRLRKFARKNRAALTMAAVIGLLLVAGIVGTTAGLLEARSQTENAKAETREKDKALRAEAEAREAEKTRADSERQAKEAKERERKYAQAIADFVKDDFLALTSVEGQWRFGDGSEVALNKDTTLRQLLDRAAAKLNKRQDLDPRTEAALRWMIGVNYRGMGEALLAIPYLARCVALRKQLLGSDHGATLNAQNSLAVAYGDAGMLDLSIPLHEENLKLSKAKLGADHPDTLMIMRNLAADYGEADKLDLALPLSEETLKLMKAKLGPDDRHTLLSMNNLAICYQQTDKLDLALPLLEETLKLM